jgi:hypothetical protein
MEDDDDLKVYICEFQNDLHHIHMDQLKLGDGIEKVINTWDETLDAVSLKVKFNKILYKKDQAAYEEFTKDKIMHDAIQEM